MIAKTGTAPVIQLKGLTKRYGIGDTARDVLDSVNLKIEQGEFIAVMGPSGCGKTTLLNVIGLLDRPDSGEYSLNGTSAARLSGAQRARARATQIGIVFQSFNLINRLTVLENVALPLTYQGVSRVKRLERASEILKTFHLQEREYYMPWQLSGGQMQRVAIARALVSKPSIILADEPTGNLDSRSSHVIMEELAQLHKQGNTIIMVTHNPNLTSYASRVINMLDGKIASDTKIRIASGNESEKPVKVSLNARRAAKEEKSETRSAKKKPAKEAKNDDQPAANDPEPSEPDGAEASSSGQPSDQTERKKAES